MRTAAIFAVTVVLLASVASSWGSLLPFMDRQDSWLTERFPDPFRVLEHIPFGLDRDDVAVAVSPARVDWKETPTAHHIMIDVPGLKREEVKVEVDENGILTVTGERKKEEEKKGDHWHRVERAYGRFWRQFRLPNDVDTDSVSAKMDHGVLTVTASKLPPEKTKGARVVSIGAEEGTEKEKKKMEL